MSKHNRHHNNMSNKEEKVNVTDEKETEQTKSESNKSVQSEEKNRKSDDKKSTEKENTIKDSESKEETKSPLDDANAQIEELKDKYLRSVAEFDNYRKRTIKEKAELILNGSEKTINAILPIIDDLERAIANADKTEDPKILKEGMTLIYQKFSKTLEGLGLKRIETTDKDFDTDYHEAIAMVPGQGDEKKGKVLDCVQAGYTLNDKVIRHAKVAVGQ